ncbi:hypothetical protein E2C01_033170 [Portunus trituberculatus]|uniref:PHD-type domain-containing protein n=1 Tax=Portunus trituberculatus TaxID=210409 RepID=A0A5B7F2R4_PORTR|nr:hypothetical protein [Portunus trituberculatus]
MFNSDSKKCKEEVTRRCREVACERCYDWYHVECVGLKGAVDRVLKNRNLLFLCSGCFLSEGGMGVTQVKSEVEGCEAVEAREDTPRVIPDGKRRPNIKAILDSEGAPQGDET